MRTEIPGELLLFLQSRPFIVSLQLTGKQICSGGGTLGGEMVCVWWCFAESECVVSLNREQSQCRPRRIQQLFVLPWGACS